MNTLLVLHIRLIMIILKHHGLVMLRNKNNLEKFRYKKHMVRYGKNIMELFAPVLSSTPSNHSQQWKVDRNYSLTQWYDAV